MLLASILKFYVNGPMIGCQLLGIDMEVDVSISNKRDTGLLGIFRNWKAINSLKGERIRLEKMLNSFASKNGAERADWSKFDSLTAIGELKRQKLALELQCSLLTIEKKHMKA